MFPQPKADQVKAPQGPATPERQLEAVLILKAVLGDMLSPGSAEEAEKKVRERMKITDRRKADSENT